MRKFILQGMEHKFAKQSDKAILEVIEDSGFGSDAYNHGLAILQVRYAKRLVIATWFLVVATLLLALEAVLMFFIEKG